VMCSGGRETGTQKRGGRGTGGGGQRREVGTNERRGTSGRATRRQACGTCGTRKVGREDRGPGSWKKKRGKFRKTKRERNLAISPGSHRKKKKNTGKNPSIGKKCRGENNPKKKGEKNREKLCPP